MLRFEGGIRIARISALLVCLAPALLSQGAYAVTSGVVKDSSNAVIPGVGITARNVNLDVALQGSQQ